MITIGLTGGIGTGKTTVSRTLAELGAHLIDADKVGHEMLEPGTPVWHDCVAAWGRDILNPDDTIDRRKLGAIVFGNPDELQRLNAISHPRIKATIAQRLESLRQAGTTNVAVVEAAILIEAKWHDIVDQVWMTDAPEEVAIARLQARNGLTADQALARIRSQLTAEERGRYAQVIISTDCTLDELRGKVETLWQAVQRDTHGVPSRI